MIILFGGWGFPPEILEPIFGADARYIDVNKLFPFVVDDGRLRNDWNEIVHKAVMSYLTGDELMLAGWSAGSVIALALSPCIKPKRMMLLSPTPSFCRREGFAFGWKPAALQSMRAQLDADCDAAVRRFCGLCDLGASDVPRINASTDQMIAGTVFLEHASALPMEKAACPMLILHGRKDRIVPSGAGEWLARECGARYKAMEGGHAFFLDNSASVKTEIDAFIKPGDTALS
jgi:pimeloyl-ACP methyl ester carboxylesterase